MFTHVFWPYNKYLRPEFFPTRLIYLYTKSYIFWKFLRTKNPLRYTAANPWFDLWWLYPTSKYESLKYIPKKWLPLTKFIAQANFEKQYISQLIVDSGMWYPCILKPDNGVRGLGIQILHSQDEFDRVINNFVQSNKQRWDYLLQEFVSHPEEYGIMYIRMPDADTWSILGMVKKEFVSIHWDGVSTLEQLIHAHPRARYHFPLFAEQFAATWTKTLPKWEMIDVVETWTHSRGSTFLDASHLVTDELVSVIDEISQQVEWFYCGRFDAKAHDIDWLLAGEFKIMELNMTYSEPTWMYDPSYSFVDQQQILLWYWKLVYDISIKNHALGVPYATLSERYVASSEYNRHVE